MPRKKTTHALAKTSDAHAYPVGNLHVINPPCLKTSLNCESASLGTIGPRRQEESARCGLPKVKCGV